MLPTTARAGTPRARLLASVACLAALVSACRCSEPLAPLAEFANRDEEETAAAVSVDCRDDVLMAVLPDGTTVTFRRVWTLHGFFDESDKSLSVSSPQHDYVSLLFGRNHSGYRTAEIRANREYTRFWVLSVGERQRHMHSGAAVDLQTGETFSEGNGGWATAWARPDRGVLVARRTFGSAECPGLSPRPPSPDAPEALAEVDADGLRRFRSEMHLHEWEGELDEQVMRESRAVFVRLVDEIIELGRQSSRRRVQNAITRATLAFNELDSRHGFIETIGAESLIDLLCEVADLAGIEYDREELVSARDW